jgi:hypothetical protein
MQKTITLPTLGSDATDDSPDEKHTLEASSRIVALSGANTN